MLQDKIIQHISSRLKHLRTNRHLTLEYLAQKIGLSRKQVQNYEAALCNIPITRLWQLAQCLEVDLNYFTKGLNTKNNYTDEDEELVKLFHNLKDKNIRAHILSLLKELA